MHSQLRCRPVTDFAAPLILLPAQLGGNNIGVLAASLFPRAHNTNAANHKSLKMPRVLAASHLQSMPQRPSVGRISESDQHK